MASDPYLLGHSDHELRRLEQQAEIFEAATEDTLRRAGLAAGMRVLDIGCGVGDVTLAAARLVGPTGRVLGVDRSQDAVRTANRRMATWGLHWASCVVGDVHDRQDDPFDAVVGRFILMHLPARAELLEHLRASVVPHGVVAFIEMDIGSASITPSKPVFDRCVAAIAEIYEKVGAEPNMGSRLYATFRRAGLEPTLHGSCRVEGASHAKVFDYLAGSMQSLLPSLQAHGIDLGFGVDTLRERLRAEAEESDCSIAYPRLIGAWARIDAATAPVSSRQAG